MTKKRNSAPEPPADQTPKLTSKHSHDVEALRNMDSLVDKATELHRENVHGDTCNAERSASILVSCVELLRLCSQHPDEFREIKRRFGCAGSKRGTYNTSEREARDIVKLVLRFEKSRSLITRYTHALSHLAMVEENEGDLGDYVREKGGLNACARAWQEYKRDLRPQPAEPEVESELESTPDQIKINVPDQDTLYFCDPDGFHEPVPADLADAVIRTMQELRQRRTR